MCVRSLYGRCAGSDDCCGTAACDCNTCFPDWTERLTFRHRMSVAKRRRSYLPSSACKLLGTYCDQCVVDDIVKLLLHQLCINMFALSLGPSRMEKQAEPAKPGNEGIPNTSTTTTEPPKRKSVNPAEDLAGFTAAMAEACTPVGSAFRIRLNHVNSTALCKAHDSAATVDLMMLGFRSRHATSRRYLEQLWLVATFTLLLCKCCPYAVHWMIVHVTVLAALAPGPTAAWTRPRSVGTTNGDIDLK